jgi:glycine/D-amino acid oxidase-like deaminating enzyme
MKMAMHLSPAKEDVRCERSTIDRCVSSRDEANMRELVSVHMPLFNGPVVSTATCMYTSTEDGHFLVDWLPSSTGGPSNVLLCSPCSGHGFKMATVIGEIVQQLIQTGKTEHDISLFKLETR